MNSVAFMRLVSWHFSPKLWNNPTFVCAAAHRECSVFFPIPSPEPRLFKSKHLLSFSFCRSASCMCPLSVLLSTHLTKRRGESGLMAFVCESWWKHPSGIKACLPCVDWWTDEFSIEGKSHQFSWTKKIRKTWLKMWFFFSLNQTKGGLKLKTIERSYLYGQIQQKR